MKSSSLVMCSSLLFGAEVGCDPHQLIPGSKASPSPLVFIYSSLSNSQALSSLLEKLRILLIFSDNLDTSNIAFLYPLFLS